MASASASASDTRHATGRFVPLTATGRLVPLTAWNGVPDAWKQQREFHVVTSICDTRTSPIRTMPLPDEYTLRMLPHRELWLVHLVFLTRPDDTMSFEEMDAKVEMMMQELVPFDR